jgi:hypothetical protein
LPLAPPPPPIPSPSEVARPSRPQTRLAKTTIDKISRAIKVPNGRELSIELVPYIQNISPLFPKSIRDQFNIPANMSKYTPLRDLRMINEAIYDAYRDLTNPLSGRGLHRMHGGGFSKKP